MASIRQAMGGSRQIGPSRSAIFVEEAGNRGFIFHHHHKDLRMRHLAFLLILLLAPTTALAANRTVKVRGVIGLCGTSQCGIGELNPGYLFLPRTKIASQILNVCGEGDDCEITGVVDKQDYFVSVSNVRLVDTNIEPSKDVIFRAAEWLFEIRDDDSVNGVYIRYVDMVRFQRIKKKAHPVWFAKIVVYGYKNKQPITIGPGDVFLGKRQGEWHFYKTRP